MKKKRRFYRLYTRPMFKQTVENMVKCKCNSINIFWMFVKIHSSDKEGNQGGGLWGSEATWEVEFLNGATKAEERRVWQPQIGHVLITLFLPQGTTWISVNPLSTHICSAFPHICSKAWHNLPLTINSSTTHQPSCCHNNVVFL